MAIFSSTSIIRATALFHLTTAYFLLVSPSTIAKYNLVVLFSQSFGMPYTSSSFARPSALSALLSAVLAYYGIADLAASSMHAQISTLFWSVQAPFRAAFFMFLCVWSYSLRPGGLFVDRAEALRLGTRKGAGEDLGNGIILTWAFLEMMCWFWIWITLREEMKEAAPKLHMEQDIGREKIM